MSRSRRGTEPRSIASTSITTHGSGAPSIVAPSCMRSTRPLPLTRPPSTSISKRTSSPTGRARFGDQRDAVAAERPAHRHLGAAVDANERRHADVRNHSGQARLQRPRLDHLALLSAWPGGLLRGICPARAEEFADPRRNRRHDRRSPDRLRTGNPRDHRHRALAPAHLAPLPGGRGTFAPQPRGLGGRRGVRRSSRGVAPSRRKRRTTASINCGGCALPCS